MPPIHYTRCQSSAHRAQRAFLDRTSLYHTIILILILNAPHPLSQQALPLPPLQMYGFSRTQALTIAGSAKPWFTCQLDCCAMNSWHEAQVTWISPRYKGPDDQKGLHFGEVVNIRGD